MAYYQQAKKENLNDFIRSNFSYYFGSLANLYTALIAKGLPAATPEEMIKMIENKAIEIANNVYNQTESFDDFPELDKEMAKLFAEERERKVGRFYASEIWALLNNKVLPEKFFEKEKKTPQEMWRMNAGTLFHKGIQDLFGFEEKKYELEIQKDPEVVIVCKVDLELGDRILEFKSRDSVELSYGIPEWYQLQLECYCQAKKVKEITLWVVNLGGRKSYLYQSSEAVWEKIKKGVLDYDKKLRELTT